MKRFRAEVAKGGLAPFLQVARLVPARSLVHAVDPLRSTAPTPVPADQPTAKVIEAVRALDHLDLGDRQEIYLGLRALFVTRPEERPIFDRCFESVLAHAGRARSARPGARRAGDPGGHGGCADRQPGRAHGAAGARGLGRGGRRRGGRRAAQRAGGVRAGGAGLARLLDLQRRAARGGPAAHRADRPPAGASGQPAAPAGPAARAASTCGARCGRISRGARSSSCATGGARSARCGSSCSATSRARWISTAASSCSSSSRCSTCSRGWRPSRSRRTSPGSPNTCKARSYRQVLRRLQDVRDWSGGTRIGESLAEFNRAVAVPGGPPHDRDRAVRRLGYRRPGRAGHRAPAHQAPRRPR